MLPKPQISQQPKEMKSEPKIEDKKNYHFMYICKKSTDPIADSSDEEVNNNGGGEEEKEWIADKNIVSNLRIKNYNFNNLSK